MSYLYEAILVVIAAYSEAVRALSNWLLPSVQDLDGLPRHKRLLHYLFSYLIEYQWLALFALAIVAGIIKFKHARKTARTKRKLVAEYFRRVHLRYFCTDSGEADPNFRITFFQPSLAIYRRGEQKMVRLGKFLVMRARSNEKLSRSDVKIATKPVETASRRNDIVFDGIVGEVWCTGIKKFEENLPNIESASKKVVTEYRRRTNLDHLDNGEFEKFSMKPRSIVAVAIRNRQSEKVGVLVIESKHPKITDYLAPRNQNKRERMFSQVVFDDIAENLQIINEG